MIHLEQLRIAVALEKTCYSYKTIISKLQSFPWRALAWHSRMQLVEIFRVFDPFVKVMHSANQPNKGVKKLENVMNMDFQKDALVLWRSEYLIMISSTEKKRN